MLLTPWYGCLLVLAPEPTTAIVALSDAPETVAAVQSISESWTKAGKVIESSASIATELIGTPAPKNPDDAAVQRMLEDARQREAHFDTPGANALRRQILRVFDNLIRPTRAMRRLAGEAGLDTAAALLGEGKKKAAVQAAKEVLRRFQTPVDTLRHPPATVSFFESQRQAVARGKQVEVTVISNRAGTLYADGIRLGKTDGRLVADLPLGRYRIWLAWPGGMSLPHPIELAREPVQVSIDSDLDAQIDFDQVVVARCDKSCPELLAALGKRLGVARVVGVRGPVRSSAPEKPLLFSLLDVQTQTGEAQETYVTQEGEPVENAADVIVRDSMPRFSPMYLLPFGGGQFVQERPLYAAGYLSVQAGLLAWYLWTWHSWQQASDLGRLQEEVELRKRLDLSLGLFIGAVAGAVIEAVVVGWFLGE